MRTVMRQLFALGILAVGVGSPVWGQSLLERPPNLSGGWTGRSGSLYFHFVHRFNQSGSPEHKVTNSPSFLLAAGLPARTLIGAHYATNSLVAERYPNEWEVFGRYAPLAQIAGGPLDVSVQAGYNVAAASADGELSLGRRIGRVELLGAFRALGNAYHADETRFAAGGGAVVHVSEHVVLAGDVVSLLDRTEDEEVAWSAGVHVGLPYTPHTLSLNASNTHTATLQGASIGLDRIRWGFEFTVPVTLSRYFGRPGGSPPVAAARPTGAADASAKAAGAVVGDTVRISIKNLAYVAPRLEVAPGTTVIWTNDDPLAHTVTADVEGGFDSGDVAPGASWSYTFAEAGTYPYHCTPHPFMKGEVIVGQP